MTRLRQGFAGQGEPLYQLEEGLAGAVFVCLGGERLVEVPGPMAGPIAGAVERIEGTRGRQIALRWFALGVAAADPAQAAKARAGAWDGAGGAPHPENPQADFQTSPQGGGEG